MSRLLSGRRASINIPPNTLKKSHGAQRAQDSHRLNVADPSPPPVPAPHPPHTVMNKFLEKQVQFIQQKLELKLPCNSGLSLLAIESDPIVEKIAHGFIDLGMSNVDIAVTTLCSMLEKLQSRTFPDGISPDQQVLDSQLYIFKILTRVLIARWPSPPPASALASSPRSDIKSHKSAPVIRHVASASTTFASYQQSNSQRPSHCATNPSAHPSIASLRSISSTASTSWLEPRPLEEASVKYIFKVITETVSNVYNINNAPEMFPWNVVDWEPALSAPLTHPSKSPAASKDRFGDQSVDKQSRSVVARNKHGAGVQNGHAQPSGNRSILDDESRSRYTIYAHNYTPDEELHGSYLASVPVLLKKYAGRIVYHLSASNWPFVLSLLKTRLNSMAEDRYGDIPPLSPQKNSQVYLPLKSPSHNGSYSGKSIKSLGSLRGDKAVAVEPPQAERTYSDLKLVAVCIMDRTRLISILQECIIVFREMPYEAQEAASFALRRAILNWADHFPGELAELWAGQARYYNPVGSGSSGPKRKMLEGMPEHLFDIMFEHVREKNRRVAVLYPALTALICICPDRFNVAIDALERQSGTKLNLFQQMDRAFKTSSRSNSYGPNIAEQASIAYLDLIRLSFALPPGSKGEEELSLKHAGAERAADLKRYLLQPPGYNVPFYASSEPVDVNFYAYGIAAIYRFHPMDALQLMRVCIEPERSHAIKQCVVKALILLVVEAPKYPWQPSLNIAFPILAPRLRDVIRMSVSDTPEPIGGIVYTPASVPISKALAKARETDNILADVIDEKARLLMQVETLLPLEPCFLLYGCRSDEFVSLLDRTLRVGGPSPDRCEQAASIMAMGATLHRILNILPGEECYNEALDYLYYCAPFSLKSAAMMVLSCPDDRELQRLGVNSLHTILEYLAYGSQNCTDDGNAWRFSTRTIKMLDYVEFTLWVILSSAANDISAIAQDSLRLLNTWERHPSAPNHPYFSAAHFSTRCTMIDGLSGAHEIITGRQAFQKRLRKQIPLITYLTPIHMLGFNATLLRLATLGSRMDQLSADRISTYHHHEDFHEWQNLLFLIASGAHAGLECSNQKIPTELEELLPLPLRSMPQVADMAEQFVSDVVRLLVSENVHARESAKDALGNELNIKAMPILFGCLDVATRKWIGKGSAPHTPSRLIFVEQFLNVLRMIFERFDDSTAVFENHAPENCVAIGNFIRDYPVGDDQLRLKIRFGAMISVLLSKRHCFAIRDENGFRSQLSDILVTWIEQDLRTGVISFCYPRLISEARMATLKLFVLSVETLTVLPSHPSRGNQGSAQAVSQKTHHYITTLLLILTNEPPSVLISSPSPNANSFANKISTTYDMDLIHELVVSGISYILNNNSMACIQLCISRCFDDNSDVRIVFMQAFTRVFGLGIKFDQLQAVVSKDQQDPICQLVRESQILALSIVKACPSTEVETMVPVLIGLFDTPDALLNFSKAMINQEIAKTDSPVQSLRSNNLCMRTLSTIARQHGYDYLRANVRFLVNNLARTVGYTFETETRNGTAPEEIAINIDILVRNAGKLLNELLRTIDNVPCVIRKISHQILIAVSTMWPESKYPALGAFIFLRWLVPVIVSPELVNIELGEDDVRIRRGLKVVGKILQTLSNQMPYGQGDEVEIDSFLQKNMQTMVDYLIRIQTVPQNSNQNADHDLYSACGDTDALILHRFTQAYADRIGQILLNSKEFSKDSRVPAGKQAWDALCAALVDTRSALEQPRLTFTDHTHHKPYQQFMSRNKNRNIEALAETYTLHVGTEISVFILTFSAINAEVVDFELLLFKIFKTLSDARLHKSQFDVIFDFTAFTSRSVLPTPWLKLALELLPYDIQDRWRTAYMLNLNRAGHSFLRKVFTQFSGLKVAKKVVIIPSITEIRQYFPQFPSLLSKSISMSVENESAETFDGVHYQIANQPWSSGTLRIGLEYARITSVKLDEGSQELTHTTEFIHFRDVEDVRKGDNEKCVLLRHGHKDLCVKFETASQEILLNVIQKAKQEHARSNKTPLLPTARTSDTSAALLSIGLFHACSDLPEVRKAACGLLTANCTYLGYLFDNRLLYKSSYVPSNIHAFINPFTERVSAFAPQMTLDFILEWAGSFPRATTARKSICLQYLTHWIRYLERFVDPSKSLYDEEKVRKCIRVLMDITAQNPEIYPTSQRFIWLEAGKLSLPILTLILDELILMAISHGIGSDRCEIIANTLISLSTVTTRSKLLKELRTYVAGVCNKSIKSIMEASEWNAIAVLSYLSMVAGHNPRLVLHNQLYASELAHIITMLAGVGPLSMRLAVYGMTSNLFQALHAARADDETSVIQFRDIMDKLAQPEHLKLFGLVRPFPSSQMSTLDDAATEISVDALESITKLMMQVLGLGASNDDLKNKWYARWMSFVSMTAFQPAAYAQYRGFTTLSCLAESSITDNLFREILDVLKRNILRSGQEPHATEALLRCVRRSVPALHRDSKYLPLLFWLAVSFLQTDHFPFRGEVLQLLQVCIETMDKHDLFNQGSVDQNAVVTVLMKAREPISAASRRIDELSEISFEYDFGFALISTMWYDVRNRTEMTLLKGALTSILKIVVKASNPTSEEQKCLDSLTMPLFIGLGPCSDKVAYKLLLEDVCHVSSPSSPPYPRDIPDVDETACIIDAETIGIHDSRSALLAVGFLTCSGDSSVLNRQEEENTHFLWGMLAKSYPEQLGAGLWHNMEMVPIGTLSNKMDSIFSSSPSTAHLAAVSASFDLVMTISIAQSTPNGTPSVSSASLGDSTQTEYSNGGPVVSRTAIYRDKFIKIGMRGILEPFRRGNSQLQNKINPEKVKQVSPALAYVVELIQKST